METETKRRIVHLIQSLDNGGCENMLLRTLPLLDGFEHQIITLKEPGTLASEFVAKGIPVTTAHCNNPLDLPGIFRLRKRIQKEHPDIILTYLFHADMLGRFALVGTTESPIIPFLRTTYNHPRYFTARIFEWLTKLLVKQYLANSEAVKDFYVKHIGVLPEKITVIPNGIDTTCFDSLIPDEKLRTSLDLTPNDFTIICVANLHPNKGHRYLLEALELLFSEFPHLKLLVVGDGAERAALETMIQPFRSKENIWFLGQRNDVPTLLKISSLFVLPTLFEGQSNAILEAMTAGVPVITTDIPENRSLITHGETGLLVPVEDVHSLASAIRQMFESRKSDQVMARQARDTIRNRYSLAGIALQWNQFLRSLLL